MAEPEDKEVAASDKDADLPIPDILPVLPLKDVVVFPFIILPLSVSREKSINAVDAALAEQRIIMLVETFHGSTPRAGSRRDRESRTMDSGTHPRNRHAPRCACEQWRA